MFVYDLFKYEGTEYGKSLGLFSSFNKALEEGIQLLKNIYGKDCDILYDRTDNVFVITKQNDKIVNDWFEIKEIKVK